MEFKKKLGMALGKKCFSASYLVVGTPFTKEQANAWLIGDEVPTDEQIKVLEKVLGIELIN
ncbi:hypothetical protein [Vibrio parahaemolyticus]|uniref:hypothetical protein n=1 Tax=Vibrio parahaemolyticus TaxID=670 RepID=UPI00226B1619|nr:hypothetical protein [Vibrio parahaemolyticus]MCX8941280.1 hypothetical protein [Vibrio parahaemolyticus]